MPTLSGYKHLCDRLHPAVVHRKNSKQDEFVMNQYSFDSEDYILHISFIK